MHPDMCRGSKSAGVLHREEMYDRLDALKLDLIDEMLVSNHADFNAALAVAVAAIRGLQKFY